MTSLLKKTTNTENYTIFISDLHLKSDGEDTLSAFMHLLREETHCADALYILGDLFEAWVGDDNTQPCSRHVIKALARTTQTGLPIFILRGNRDFLLGYQFAAASGVTLLPDPTVISLYGRPTLLLHGDSLCTFDRLHQLWFKLTRCSFGYQLAHMIPLSWRQRLATQLRQQSHRHQQNTAHYKLDVNPMAVQQVMQQHQVDLLIHGHTHRPNVHTLDINQQTCTRIVLGDWYHQSSLLRYYSPSHFTLEHQAFDQIY